MDLPQKHQIEKTVSAEWYSSFDDRTLNRKFTCVSSDEVVALVIALVQIHCDDISIEANPDTHSNLVVVKTSGKIAHPNTKQWLSTLKQIELCYEKIHQKHA